MSLFTELYTLTKQRRFAMLVSSDHETGLLTICVMPRALNEADGQYCKDLTLTARPEDFDSDFISAIDSYRGKILPLLDQAKEATAAIDKTAKGAKAAAVNKPAGKTASKAASSTPGKTGSGAATVADKAAAYRDASSGDSEADEEPNNDWMKNRQPELF